MANDSPTTDPQNPGATDDDAPASPAATNSQGGGAATDDEEVVTLKKSDYKNLVSARDRANENDRTSQEFLEEIAAERSIKAFLKENKEKFPDVKFADLQHATPATLEAEAARVQRRLEDHAQNRIMNIEKATAPVLSPEQREAELKKLKESNDPAAFEKMAELRMAA